MPVRHVVVDGSNIATEGRSLPSLAQLDQAVREFLAENPDDTVTVVVDASFAHRIDPSELATFEEAEAAGEVVSPPAGAIGRGDAFLLRIADKIGATVLSNDSFQEFHGEHEWLFERGRLIGGKPVPEVGWIYTPRTPVRGPKSREAVKEAKRKRQPPAGPEGATGLDLAAQRGRGRGKKVERAIATATEEAVAPDESPRRRRRKTGEPPADPVNEPLAFITFIAAHPLGTEVTGVVDSFSSHGAFVDADGARCYVPLSGIGDPPPRSAREVLGKKGDEHVFAVQALDPLRRGVELALPAFARVAGVPTEETVEAEIEPRPRRGREPAAKPQVAAKRTTAKKTAARKGPSRPPASEVLAPEVLVDGAVAEGPVPKKAPATRAPAKRAPAKRAPAKKAPAKKVTASKTPAEKTPAGKAPAKKAAAKAAPSKKVAAKKVAAKKAPAKKVPAKKAPAGRVPTAKRVVARGRSGGAA